jgi:sterol desaturase/sphingolipid hydroxylase (fatty acid hydroxylase superfamily)
MRLSKALYFGDLVASPIAIVILAALALAGRDYQAVGLWLLALLAGICAWTLVEYLVHRFIYHAVPIFERYHDAHHENPEELIGAPSFLMIGFILIAFFTPLLAFGILVASGVTSGALIGYIGYMLVHHASHHFEPKPGTLLYEARLRHMAHHFHGTPGNYGIITSFWDHVFSTSVERRRVRSRDSGGK